MLEILYAVGLLYSRTKVFMLMAFILVPLRLRETNWPPAYTKPPRSICLATVSVRIIQTVTRISRRLSISWSTRTARQCSPRMDSWTVRSRSSFWNLRKGRRPSSLFAWRESSTTWTISSSKDVFYFSSCRFEIPVGLFVFSTASYLTIFQTASCQLNRILTLSYTFLYVVTQKKLNLYIIAPETA